MVNDKVIHIPGVIEIKNAVGRNNRINVKSNTISDL